MFRLTSTVTLFLLCIALTHGAPRYSDTDYCDGRLCNVTCMKQAEHSHDRGVYGKCDAKGACRCYHKEMCAADTCKNMCEVKHGSEENLRHECANDVCTCTWTKKCDPAACETACQKVYAGKPHTQSHCEKTLCRCSWHGEVLRHINEKFFRLLANNHSWLTIDTLANFSKAIYIRGAPLTNCWGFIDGTARAICQLIRQQLLYFSGHKSSMP
ncbi:hypothetical protein MRX96_038226 [Rhipicephalus microplus]